MRVRLEAMARLSNNLRDQQRGWRFFSCAQPGRVMFVTIGGMLGSLGLGKCLGGVTGLIRPVLRLTRLNRHET